jgi:rhodanese-related sulfurtransferase
MNIEEVTVEQVQEKLNNGDECVIMDVREWDEINLVKFPISDVKVVPMSEIISTGLDAFPGELMNRDADIVTICHHGIRSAQITYWLNMQGWKNVKSMRGGLEEYAHGIDPSIGTY